MKLLLIFLLLPLSAKQLPLQPLPFAKPADVGMSPEALAKIDPAVENLIETKRLAGGSVIVLRKGHIVYQKQFGLANRAEKKPIKKDTLFRIYSMTKGITSAAAMMLFDEGKLDLDAPISKHLPEFKNLTVWQKDGDPVPADPTPTIRDLLRHTAGFSYGWSTHPVDAFYQKAQPLDRNKTLAEMTQAIADIPLLYQPGTQWVYGINTDVLARVVEVASGQTFDKFLQARLFTPLGMPDTGFHVPAEKNHRLADVFGGKAGILVTTEPAKGSQFLKKPAHLSGGGGLVSTINDYARFLQMIANGGTFQGKRYLKAKTVKLMTTNQLPDEIPAISLGVTRHGVGFGLGFNVRISRDKRWDKHAPVGEFGWGGMASTHYWVSPKHDLVVVTMEQTLPYNANLEDTLKPIIYQAVKN
ncbi:MAG: CubicO group peptidase (beta-lactamase class C family) [Akkermansiaceae bacterium]|jgi:CubicO group peptidase (beta-lactamase class C family)